MKTRANDFRVLGNVRRVLTRWTNITWDEAKRRFPWHSSDENLSHLLGLNFIKSISDSFWIYCQAALRGENNYEKNNVTYQGYEAAVIELKINKFTIADLQISYPSYSGANLILTSIPKVVNHKWLWITTHALFTSCFAFIGMDWYTNQTSCIDL